MEAARQVITNDQTTQHGRQTGEQDHKQDSHTTNNYRAVQCQFINRSVNARRTMWLPLNEGFMASIRR